MRAMQLTDLIDYFHWGDVPTWLAAIGTVGALWVAVIQYVANSRRRKSRSRREQAEAVTAWIVDNSGVSAWLAVQNQSKNPIYETIVTLVPFQGSGDPTGKTTPMGFRAFLSVVPPGLSYIKTAGHTGMHFHPAAKIVFTDSSGNNWAREGDGSLAEVEQKPMEYYGIPRPISWQYPRHSLPPNIPQ